MFRMQIHRRIPPSPLNLFFFFFFFFHVFFTDCCYLFNTPDHQGHSHGLDDSYCGSVVTSYATSDSKTFQLHNYGCFIFSAKENVYRGERID